MEFTSTVKPGNPKFQDLTGKRFSRLVVTEFAGMKGKRSFWRCRCDCGNETLVASNHLKAGNVKSCKCALSDRLVDLVGKRFGRWVVLKRVKKDRHWLCRCDCGNEVEVHGESLKAGTSTSCGCRRDEVSAKNMRELQVRMHAEGRGGRTTHGMAYSAEHKAWQHMKSRCENLKTAFYENYGGRGIKVSERWRESFANFLTDLGPRPSPEHSLDRIDVNGNYEPGNVRWATRIEQAANTRRKRLEQFPVEERAKSLSIEEIRAELARRGLHDPFAELE